jgi:site-specific recombinase XerD
LRKGHLLSAKSGASLRSSRAKGGGLSRCVDLWIADGQAAGWSPRTIAFRRDMLSMFSWCLNQEEIPDRLEAITAENIRFFLAYLRADAPSSRWGGEAVNAAHPARPSTVDTYYRCLRTFCNFVVRERLLKQSPMTNLRRPRVPKDQVQPFTPEQAQALVDAAKVSDQVYRNTSIVLVLLDTGLRVGELCQLT